MAVPPLESPWWLPGGHLQTIVPALVPSPAVGRPVEALWVEVEAGTSVRLDVSRPEGSARGTLLLVHGMGGSARSPYVLRTARQALAAGWAVARMNLRSCGGTESRASTLYNAGQAGDAARALEAIEAAGLPAPFAAAGFSLGGNLLLRHAGLAGAGCRAAAVAAVNPPIDLGETLAAIERPSNALYHLYFVSALCAHLRRVRRVRPVPGPRASLASIRTLRRFDDAFTAPDAGYRDADDYYERASSYRVLEGIRVPALVLSARNDPFVPAGVLDRHRNANPRHLEVQTPPTGGHCGYRAGVAEGFWAGAAALEFIERRTARPAPR